MMALDMVSDTTVNTASEMKPRTILIRSYHAE
jgi:hypothetical protein